MRTFDDMALSWFYLLYYYIETGRGKRAPRGIEMMVRSYNLSHSSSMVGVSTYPIFHANLILNHLAYSRFPSHPLRGVKGPWEEKGVRIFFFSKALERAAHFSRS